MIVLIQNNQLYNNDIRAMIMAFYPGVKIREEFTMDKEDCDFTVELDFSESLTTIRLFGKELDKSDFVKQNNIEIISRSIPGDYRDKTTFRNKFKKAAYGVLVDLTGRELPWGDMTGVRPTKVAMAKLKSSLDYDEVVKYYESEYMVSHTKAELATAVAQKELSLLDDIDWDNDYCLYIGIPFCPSRCLYCSFTSYPIALYEKRANEYVDKLISELSYIGKKYSDKRLVSIYIGGGTPTSVSHILLDKILTHIEEVFNLNHIKEFTVEAGRPDSITIEKLTVMKKHGVSRISINPQTMNDATLKTIGRAHTSQQAKDAFLLARECGFDNINMDLIAGLPGEDKSSMSNTLKEIEKLNPESITVHSLAIKRAANLNQQLDEMKSSIHHDMDEMLDMVSHTANQNGMEPYYLYRQKNIGGNLENVGYSKPGCECLYNILIMEEITDIIAAGAGASTKLTYHSENRVERVENCKSVDDYIDRFEEMLSRKEAALN